MCHCTPTIRTPFCGKGCCVWPPKAESNPAPLFHVKQEEKASLVVPPSPWTCCCAQTQPYRCPVCYAAHLEAELARANAELEAIHRTQADELRAQGPRLPGVKVPRWLEEP